MKNKWIACKDKVPDSPINVLCYCQSTDCPAGNFVVAFYINDKWKDGFYSHDHEVSHWMPLPNKPND